MEGHLFGTGVYVNSSISHFAQRTLDFSHVRQFCLSMVSQMFFLCVTEYRYNARQLGLRAYPSDFFHNVTRLQE